MNQILLFDKREKCCGCGACMNACPKQAISMCPDEYGFLYPKIDREKCIECGMCKKVCAYQKEAVGSPAKETYVAMEKDEEQLKDSASGGIFAAIATEVIKNGGTVFGCSMELIEGKLKPLHIMVEKQEELVKLQGSKYVQSYIGTTYKQVKQQLQNNRLVLFSGTPCQIAGLNSYLGKTYPNLFTIDIICHGVPNADFFGDYISNMEKRLGSIIAFNFRDKKNGWGLEGSVIYKNRNGVIKKKLIPVQLSSYYQLFLSSDIYRENCYTCKYAGANRTGDITIGDYWGITKEHPMYLIDNGGKMDEKKGISCILVNTHQGELMIEQFGSGLKMQLSTFEKASNQNEQLKAPSHRSDNREMLLNLYKEKGYSAVEDWYYQKIGIEKYKVFIKKYIYIVWRKVPKNMQKAIKTLRHRA